MNDYFLRPSFPALLALIVGITLRVYFMVETPIGGESKPHQLSSYNDEFAHAQYIKHVIEHHDLPRDSEPINNPGALERGRFENYQHPLYYFLVAGVCESFGIGRLSSVVLAGRWINFALYFSLLWIAWLIVRQLGLSQYSRFASVVLISLSGIFVRFTTTAGNDPLFWLCAGLALLLMLRMSSQSHTWKQLSILSVVFAFGIYTKLSMILLLPALFFCLRPKEWGRAALVTIVSLLLTLPVWLRNLEYFGSLIPLRAGFGVPLWYIPGSDFFAYCFRSALFPWSEFWQGWIGLVILSVPVITILWIELSSRGKVRTPLILTVAFWSVVLSFVYLNLQYNQAEARYLFAAWPALLFFSIRAVNSTKRLWVLFISLLIPYLLFLT